MGYSHEKVARWGSLNLQWYEERRISSTEFKFSYCSIFIKTLQFLWKSKLNHNTCNNWLTWPFPKNCVFQKNPKLALNNDFKEEKHNSTLYMMAPFILNDPEVLHTANSGMSSNSQPVHNSTIALNSKTGEENLARDTGSNS